MAQGTMLEGQNTALEAMAAEVPHPTSQTRTGMLCLAMPQDEYRKSSGNK